LTNPVFWDQFSNMKFLVMKFSQFFCYFLYLALLLCLCAYFSRSVESTLFPEFKDKNCVIENEKNLRLCISVQTRNGPLLISQYVLFGCSQELSQNCENGILASSCLSVRPSVRMEQLGSPHSHWTDFHGIWYFSIFRKSDEKIQVLLKSDKHNGLLTWKQIYSFDHILLRMRNVTDKSCRDNQNTF
jgi:hypothetical protein